ncbi:hypothetical protein DXG01_005272 [Tephrocybe rancida]|nr:hypothetical protein DXG01_005272 [Tephrocybe rancida]
MANPYRIPPELILEVIELHLADRPSLASCALTARFLRNPSQKIIFSSVDLVFSKDKAARNRELDAILTRNPTIASFIQTLFLTITHDLDEIPISLPLFSEVCQLTINANTRLSEKIIVDAIEILLHLPTHSSVAFKSTDTLLPIRLLRACHRVESLSVERNTNFNDDTKPEASDDVISGPPPPLQAKIGYLTLLDTRICSRILEIFDLRRLRGLTVGYGPEWRDVEILIGHAALSLTELSIMISDNHIPTSPMSLASTPNLCDIAFSITVTGYPSYLNFICNALQTLPLKSNLHSVKISLFTRVQTEVPSECHWKRLDQVIPADSRIKRLQVCIYNCEQDITTEIAEASVESYLPNLMSVGKVIFGEVD